MEKSRKLDNREEFCQNLHNELMKSNKNINSAITNHFILKVQKKHENKMKRQHNTLAQIKFDLIA